jgi:hypothetical protein
MRRPLLVFLSAFVLGACALPFGPQPGGEANAPTAAALPTRMIATPAPTAMRFDASPTPEDAAAKLPLDSPETIAAAKPAERDQVALAEAFKGIGEIPTVARTTPLDVKVGDIETFWVSDLANNTNYQVKAQLRYAGPVLLMYVDTTVEVAQPYIEKSAKEFEDSIYQRDRELFGHELSPGIDGDPRLTVLNTPLNGAGGYFSSADGVVKAVNRFSNEREMFVIGINSYPIGDPSYGSTLAHEFQHMIEWNVARRSPSWFNEGMSTLAEDLNGYIDNNTPRRYLEDPDLQLTTWSTDAATSGNHYGASQLFLRYFFQQYGSDAGIAELIKADAGNNLDVFAQVAARKRPEIKQFADVYADWAVANVLNDLNIDGGRYAYKLLPGPAATSELKGDQGAALVNQFGVDYYDGLTGPMTLSFDGSDSVGLIGTEPREGSAMWWSNRGDDSVETLTREVDLSGVKSATLQFAAWYEIELDWDYGFVTVSTDGGKNWTTLQSTTTTTSNPQDANFGNGFTGVSGSPGTETDKGVRGAWIDEKVDLSPYAGQKVLLRFWMVNDAAYNAQGMALDNIRIPELNYADGAEDGDGGWQAEGFVRTSGELAQTWALRLIRTNGGTPSVEPVAVDEQGRATVQLANGERGTLAVIGTTPFTTEPARYSYSVTKP